MVVWDLPHDAITEAGPQLAALPGVTLCYERVPVEGAWPYRLYSMIHAKSREDALEVLDRAANLPGLEGRRRTSRCSRPAASARPAR